MAWIETTQPGTVWDRDIYGDVFRTIRDVNRKLPKARRLRVLLGDNPYTYDPANPGAMMMRTDQFVADLVQREVIAKGRKALMVYGEGHYYRRPFRAPVLKPEEPTPPTIVTLLEKAGVKVFSVWTQPNPRLEQDLPALQADIAQWPKPSLTLIKGTPLGLAPFPFYAKGTMFWFADPADRKDVAELIGGTMQEQTDAILYLGPKSELTTAKLSATLCADPDYVEMRAKRLNPRNTPSTPERLSRSDAFRAECKAALEGAR
jgi:hypothetical protein